MTDNEELFKKLQERAMDIKQFNVEQLGIFGSFARGDATETSDIDILVKFNDGHKKFKSYMGLKFYLEGLLGREVDLVTSESIRKEIQPHIKEDIRYVKGL
ncbi:nucleotidyltransferase family protein [Ectobacillus sp. JY-23]|uniref:nucleotidyltransferase family protein n=1 Tax=Ectobacillus sp. JY-23 TaxID=2933872 RepID=UPI001FF5E32E|nr:nucleotidyltransferase family protein [Ectobacillus sp. JY-23]UOY91838.1 nucleotidyltransferase family protein [Ectobacillus sp. JY-23]